MKKILSILFALISTACLAFAFGGCDKTVKVNGTFYSIEQAYVNGWLDEDDLKSIACSYYDYYFRFEENPYSGMFTSMEKLAKKTEDELKQAYLEQIALSPTISRDKVSITGYYGTYNGNIVIRGNCKGVFIDYEYARTLKIGGVIFKEFWGGKCLVYHINQADENQTDEQPIEVRGQMYNLEEAYNKGYLSEDDLKGIACDFYNKYLFRENPYSGAFTSAVKLTDKIEKEIKQAYLEQVVGLVEGDVERVEILHNYGFYNDNFIVSIDSSYLQYDYEQVVGTKEIGGVIFKDFYWDGEFFVYHLN